MILPDIRVAPVLHKKPELWENLPSALYKKLRCQIAPARGEVVCTIRNGLRMQIDRNDPISKAIYLYRCYEYPVTKLIETLIAPTMVFFDIGANAGFFSLLASTKCERIFAFEPLPSNLRRIAGNLAINALHNVTIIAKAVGDREGISTLYVPESANSGLASLNKMAGAESIEIPVITLDGFMQEQRLSRADLIKIDIEGAEVLAFEGGRQLLAGADAPDIVFEAHPGSDAAKWLRSRGYTIYEFRLQREWEARNLFASKKEIGGKLKKQLQECEP